MFIDLLDKKIQPMSINIENVPDIKLSNSLRENLQKALHEEEKKYVKISDKNSIVQTDKSYVFFSNQWFYLAILCKKFAESLKPYGDFFDNNIRKNNKIITILKNKDYSNPDWYQLLPNSDDRIKMEKYIDGNSPFRPGKALINSTNIRTTKDIFDSCVLKKIPVPDESSGYLGTLIYYLSKRPDLYNKLDIEIRNQIKNVNNFITLSETTNICAQQIIDLIYKIDKFEKIKYLLEENEKFIKINISKTEGLLPSGNFLRYLFAKQNSESYNSKRIFNEKEYTITFNTKKIVCKLTNQWVNSDPEINEEANNLKALIKIINKFYNDDLEIKYESEKKYFCILKKNFKLENLPSIFQNKFTQRYITSLLAKPFVILTGNSGTGKTRIAKKFAEYLEESIGNNEKNWLLVPVGADWTDNTKILGYFNPLANEGKGEYVKSNILKFIENANKPENKDIPFFLILDEMNLSHVERYFSDFLSHMETPDIPFELDGYDKKINYPKNLFITGTVNIDETTYMFSPKVLDRANVIEFKPKIKDVMNLFKDPNEEISSSIIANNGTSQAFLKLSKEIFSSNNFIDDTHFSFSQNDDNQQFLKNIDFVYDIFSEIYKIIEKNNFEFAFRTVKEIRQYILASSKISVEDEVNLNEIIDEQLLQKILPKIHGNEKEIGQLLEELIKLCEKYDLKLSESKIKQMKGKLANVQYASFI